MSKSQENFQKLLTDSEKLVKNIESLSEEIGAYKNAKESINDVKETLCSFIEQTQSLSNESHKIIKIMNDIGSLKILKKLEENKSMLQSIINIQNKNEKLQKLLLYILCGGFIIIALLIIAFK